MKSCGKLSKSCQKLQHSDFQSEFLCQRLSHSFWIYFSLKNIILGAHFCYWHFLKISIFKPLYFLKWHPIFYHFYSTYRKTSKLFNGLVISFGPKWEGLVKCVTLCVKSWVILWLFITNDIYECPLPKIKAKGAKKIYDTFQTYYWDRYKKLFLHLL